MLFPAALLVGVAQVFYTRGLFEVLPKVFSGSTGIDELTRLQTWTLLSNAVSPVYLLATYYIASCVLGVAPALLAGGRPTVRSVLKGGWSRFGWLLLTGLVVQTAAGVGSMFFVIPGLYLYARLSVARVASVVEGAPIDRAITRSWALTRGMVWRSLGFAAGLGLLALTLQSAVDSPAVIRQIVSSVTNPDALFQTVAPGWKTLEGVLSAAAVALVYPFSELAWYFYYLDLRSRREGMDLVISARELVGRSR